MRTGHLAVKTALEAHESQKTYPRRRTRTWIVKICECFSLDNRCISIEVISTLMTINKMARQKRQRWRALFGDFELIQF
jgi:hypothetical protein